MSLFAPLPDYKISCRHNVLDLSYPHIMGILNVTPDSFSDGGRFHAVDAAVAHAQQLVDAGASIIDVGGESTRPNASAVSSGEEMARVLPVVRAIRARFSEAVFVSVDTSSPEVIEAAFAAGADIWNDVRALKRQGAAEMAARLDIPVMLMHMRGEPATMGEMARYDNVVDEVISELRERVDTAVARGVNRERIIIDPGFGFAKNDAHHRALLTQLHKLQELERPLMFGISRKRFLANVLASSGVPAVAATRADERDAASMAAGLLAIQQGASIIRTHNVAMTQQAVALWRQLSAYAYLDRHPKSS